MSLELTVLKITLYDGLIYRLPYGEEELKNLRENEVLFDEGEWQICEYENYRRFIEEKLLISMRDITRVEKYI